MSPADQTPEVVEDLALGAFRMVKEKLGFDLDFTPDTLPVLDHYLQMLREEDGGQPDDTLLGVVGPCAGAYFGEVARRSLPGLRWHAPSGEYREWRLECEHAFLCFNPIGMALEALLGEASSGFHAHFTLLPHQQAAVNRSLESIGTIREDDFYRLAVRHEVLEHTLSVLERIATDQDPRSFAPEVYASVVDGQASSVEA